MHNTPQHLGAHGWTPAMPDDTTIADDTTRSLPPSQQPQYPQYPMPVPRGKPPRWPFPRKKASQARGSPYSRAAPVAPNYQPPSGYRPVPVPAPARYGAVRDRRVLDTMRAMRTHLPRFHIIHVILLAGVGAMWLAISLPWGSDVAGVSIYIRDFSIPQLSDQTVNIGQLASQTATWIAMAAVIMAGALLLINIIYALLRRLLHRIGLSVLAGVLFIPLFTLLILLLLADITLAAGFGGLSILSQLPFVRDHGFASIAAAHAAMGFYLWWFGIGAALIGTLGEVFIDRR